MMEPILFCMTFTCTLVTAFSLNVFVMDAANMLDKIFALTNFGAVLQLTFAYFLLSDWITSDLMAIDEFFYNSPWYRLPARQQRLLTLPMQRAHREIRLTGLGLVDCSLPVFAAVNSQPWENHRRKVRVIGFFFQLFQMIRSAASYFLMIRKFK